MDELRDIYGEEFLQFALLDAIESDAQTTAGQRDAITLLKAIAKPASEDEPPFVRYMNLQLRLGHYLPEQNTTAAWAIRMLSGGQLYEAPEGSDALAHNLLIVARDVWPLSLLPQPDDAPFGPGSIPTSFSHPAMQKVMNLTLSDDAFGRLFANAPQASPGSDESISTSVGVTFSTGNGHGLQPATLPGTMIGSAMLRNRLRGGNDSPQGFYDCLSEVLAEARELSRGREVVVPRLVGLTGIRLADGLEVATPFGISVFPGRSTGCSLPIARMAPN